jgi:xanthine dehydrogenase molybdenum-binding subunit
MDVVLLEEPTLPGPFGAKGLGMNGIYGIAPAIANAVYDAIGVRIKDMPLTPEKIVEAL